MSSITKLQNQYELNKIKTVIVALSLIIIGLLIVYFHLVRMPIKYLLQNDYSVHLYNNYAIGFFKNDTNNPVFTISPLDDYYYYEDSKEHLFTDLTTFKNTRDYIQESFALIKAILIGNKKLVWNIHDKNKREGIKVNYTVVAKRGGYTQITRKLYNLNPKTYVIGQSIVICNNCMVADKQKRVYLQAELLSQEQIDAIQSLKLIPFVLSQNQSIPLTNSELIIINRKGVTEATIFKDPGQEIFFDEKYHLLELKTLVKNKKQIVVSQIIKF